MSTVIALSQIFQDVRTRLATDAPGVNVVFGAKEVSKQVNQGAGRAARVVFVPGVDGKAGKYVSARSPGRNPRPLRGFNETASVYCWGYDGTQANSELAQYEAARLLHDIVVRALYLSKHGAFDISDPEFVTDKTERKFGSEIRFTLTIGAYVPDTQYEELSPTSGVVSNVITFFSGDESDGTDTDAGVAE